MNKGVGGTFGRLTLLNTANSQEPLGYGRCVCVCVHGRWGVWHDARLCCCLQLVQLAAPIGLSPLTAALPLNPFPP